jgi:hypothetical protein
VQRRSVRPEILDELSPDDARAIQSRRDLRKINTFMGHPAFIARSLRAAPMPRVLVELGAGDGTVLLNVAKRLGRPPSRVRAILIDRRPSLTDATKAAFEREGWDVESCASDVFDWLSHPTADSADAMLANLFLHHFADGDLAALLCSASCRTARFIACEPLRSRTALLGVSLMPLIGCNAVTRHDAAISVRAGFRGRELSALWPDDGAWQIAERRLGLFSQSFVAHRRVAPTVRLKPDTT